MAIITMPWIGSNYEANPNQKVLILGESHYCSDPTDFKPEITIEIIRDLYDPNSEHEPYKTSYAKGMNALAGKRLDHSGKRYWWNNHAFYNFVQEPMTGPRIKPTTAQYRNSDEAFIEVMEQLKPTHVIVWGKRLFGNLPDCIQRSTPITVDGITCRRGRYLYKDGTKAEFLVIPHPASAFSPAKFYLVIQEFLKG